MIFGVAAFAFLSIYGIDPGSDSGIRLSGAAGFCLCFTASLIFMGYNEKGLR